MKALLQFKQYHVLESHYKSNPFFEGNIVQETSYNIFFRLDINQQDNNEAAIRLGINLGDESLSNYAIYVKVEIYGLFRLETTEHISEEQRESFFKINGVAILFPYLRSLVSDLTSKGSMFPVILPTMNITAMIAELEAKNQNAEKPE